ncbi:MAG TPA: tRNA-dihydrouridine synthase family protein [Planctomycetota bacterium]|nr:tRNA-dihydrouridine synthase family protein [Planctomycetota bacterium]
MDLRATLDGAVVMAPMTKGSNVPYRRLCDELGATITMGEMALARNLLQGRRGEFALLVRGKDERVFGVQLAGFNPTQMAEAAKIAEQKGADLVDVNCGCPIDLFTRKGLGSALLRRPRKIAEIVRAMAAAVKIPVTVKIRLGWDEDDLNYLEVARLAVDAGAQAVVVHGRTRTQRYRKNADWDRISEVARALAPIPVVGNGDVLFPHEIAAFRAQAGCAGVMTARGCLIKPWIFREAKTGVAEDPTPEERLALYGRYVALAREHWRDDERGRARIREFLLWHLGWWCRHVPRRPDGTWPRMQEREERFTPRSELEALLSRNDDAAKAWVAALLLDGEAAAGPPPPPPAPAEPGAETREPMPEG